MTTESIFHFLMYMEPQLYPILQHLIKDDSKKPKELQTPLQKRWHWGSSPAAICLHSQPAPHETAGWQPANLLLLETSRILQRGEGEKRRGLEPGTTEPGCCKEGSREVRRFFHVFHLQAGPWKKAGIKPVSKTF